MSKYNLVCLVAAMTVLMTETCSAVHWDEVGDAPEGVPARQDTVGVGPLEMINGFFDSDVGDYTDTYSIIITDPAAFYATTKIDLGGSAVTNNGGQGDPKLWLWDNDGNVLLGNDDINTISMFPAGDNLGSYLSDPSTFRAATGELVNPTAGGISLQAGHTYLLSISGFPNDPDDWNGEDLVDMPADPDALHGPNPLAGPFHHWEPMPWEAAGTYRIALMGATYSQVPEPSASALIFICLSIVCALRAHG